MVKRLSLFLTRLMPFPFTGRYQLLGVAIAWLAAAPGQPTTKKHVRLCETIAEHAHIEKTRRVVGLVRLFVGLDRLANGLNDY